MVWHDMSMPAQLFTMSFMTISFRIMNVNRRKIPSMPLVSAINAQLPGVWANADVVSLIGIFGSISRSPHQNGVDKRTGTPIILHSVHQDMLTYFDVEVAMFVAEPPWFPHLNWLLGNSSFMVFSHHYLPAKFDPHDLPVKLPPQILIDGSCSSHSPVVLYIFLVVKLVFV